LIEAVPGDVQAGGRMVEAAPEPSEADSWQAEAAPGGSAGLAEAVHEVPEAASVTAEAALFLLTHEDASSEQRHHAEQAAFDCVGDDLGPAEAAFDELDWHSAEAVL
jgi:hypothetical protein